MSDTTFSASSDVVAVWATDTIDSDLLTAFFFENLSFVDLLMQKLDNYTKVRGSKNVISSKDVTKITRISAVILKD